MDRLQARNKESAAKTAQERVYHCRISDITVMPGSNEYPYGAGWEVFFDLEILDGPLQGRKVNFSALHADFSKI